MDNVLYTVQDMNTGKYLYNESKLRKAKMFQLKRNAMVYVNALPKTWKLIEIQLKIK